MPNCYQLLKNGVPQKLQEVDDDLWRVLGRIEPNAAEWYENWHNTIGFLLSLGNDFKSIHSILEQWLVEAHDIINLEQRHETTKHYAELLRVSTYLSKRYISTSWYENGQGQGQG